MRTAIMELGPKNHNGDGLLGPNSTMVVYMDPLGMKPKEVAVLQHLRRMVFGCGACPKDHPNQAEYRNHLCRGRLQNPLIQEYAFKGSLGFL